MKFFINLSLWLGIFSTLLIVLKIYFMFTYTETEKLIDRVNGVKRTWTISYNVAIALVCWIFYFTFAI